jgi:hypothetical protein
MKGRSIRSGNGFRRSAIPDAFLPEIVEPAEFSRSYGDSLGRNSQQGFSASSASSASSARKLHQKRFRATTPTHGKVSIEVPDIGDVDDR